MLQRQANMRREKEAQTVEATRTTQWDVAAIETDSDDTNDATLASPNNEKQIEAAKPAPPSVSHVHLHDDDGHFCAYGGHFYASGGHFYASRVIFLCIWG